MDSGAIEKNGGLRTLQARESNARTYARTIDRVLVQGSLAKVWDENGKEYIDCLAGAGALPLGHNHPFISRKIREFLESGQVQQEPDIPTTAKIEFVERLMAILPKEFAHKAKLQFCGPSGADAVEAAMKLFKTATGRRSVVAFHGACHGTTMGALSLAGDLGPKQAVPGHMPEVHFLPYPYNFRCPFGLEADASEQASLNYIELILTDPNSGICKPAMLILEAVQGEGGCIPASASWLRGVREITERLDIPLVIDEVQTGFARTGTMFAHEIANIVPDALVLSKAVGGGYPLSVLAYHERYDKWLPGAHAGTFRGNQIAMAAGTATMAYLMEHDMANVAARRGALLHGLLSKLAGSHRCMGQVRGRGLMQGIEIVDTTGAPDRHGRLPYDGNLARRIKRACLEEGLIVATGGRGGSVLRFLPPLVIAEQEIHELVSRFARALANAPDMPVSVVAGAPAGVA
jgi:diaminobutyrate-2-oxoglutarate transaminase